MPPPQMSEKLQKTLEASRAQERRRKIIGYVVLVAVFIGLGLVAWYIMEGGSERRFRGIEKFRGDVGEMNRPLAVLRPHGESALVS